MKLKPASLFRMMRPLLHEIDGNLVIDGVHYNTSNLAPTGNITPMPMQYSRTEWDVGDVTKSLSARADFVRDHDHGMMFFGEGSFSMSAKNLVGGVVPTVQSSFSQYNRPYGNLFQNDSRLPTHFQSTSGVTAGKSYLCTQKGILEVQPSIKRGVPLGVEYFYQTAYNTPNSASYPDWQTQQLILGESENELFGISWYDHSSGYFDAVSSSGRASSLMWRSTKKAGVIDNIAPIKFAPTSDMYELMFIGVFGDRMIALRPHTVSALSQAPRAHEAVFLRPMAMNVNTGAVSQAVQGSALAQPVSTSTVSGMRFANHVRGVVETETTISVYLPQVQTTTDPTDGVITGMVVRRFDYNKTTEAWTHTDVTIADGPYGDVMVRGASIVPGAIAFAQSLISSWIVESQGDSYLVVMHTSTNARLENVSATHEDYTHQYVYKIEANGSLTRVTKLIQHALLGRNETSAGFAMSPDRRAMYVNTYSGVIRRFLFDDVTLAYQENMQYELDAWSFHVGVDETLTAIDTAFNFYQLKPTLGSAVRVTVGEVPLFDGAPIVTTLYVSAINHLGERMATSVKLELDGPLTFVTNSQKTITVTTSATEDLPMQVQITAAGEIYCTPVLP